MPVEAFYSHPFEQVIAIDQDETDALYISVGKEVIQFKSYFDTYYTSSDKIESLSYQPEGLLIGSEKNLIQLGPDDINYKILFDKSEAAISHIVHSNYGRFILSKNTVFHFQDGVIKKYSFPGIVDFLGNVNETVILHDDTNGLSIFVGGRFKIVNNSAILATMDVVDIKSFGPGEYIVATKENGLFRFDGELFTPFAKDYLDGKTIVDLEVINPKFSPSEVVVITANKEIISLNFSGSMVYDKLFTDELLALHQDSQNRLYVVSKKGVHCLFYNLPFQVFDKSVDPIHGPISIFNDKLYWGTNNGLFYSSILETKNLLDARIRVKDTEGKVGKLDIVNGTLLMSHEDGLYDILPKIGARFIPDEKFFDFVNLNDDYLLGFSDRKAYLLKKISGKWRIKQRFTDLPVHPKNAIFDKRNQLWLVDRDYNLLQYQFDTEQASFELIQSKGHSNRIDIFSLNNELILFRDQSILRYNYEQEDFEKSEELSAIFGKNLNVEAMVNDDSGNVWYILAGEVGVFRSIDIKGKASYKKLTLEYPYADARNIYPYDKNNIWINNGSYILKVDLENYTKEKPLQLELDKIIQRNNTGAKTIFRNKSNSILTDKVSVQPGNSLQFLFDQQRSPDLEIEYALVKEDQSVSKAWANTNQVSEVKLENLAVGDYILNVRNKGYRGSSEIISIPIEVSRGIFSGKLRFLWLSLIAILLISISYLLGYIRGRNVQQSASNK